MKYTSKIILILIIISTLFISCEEKSITSKSVLYCNSDLVINSLDVWRNTDEYKNIRFEQFNKDSDLFYNHSNTSTRPEQINPIFYNNLYEVNNFNNNLQWDLNIHIDTKKEYLKLTIKDSISIKKTLVVKKDNKEYLTSTLELIVYEFENIENHETTWALTKIVQEDFYLDKRESPTPIYKYKYQIENGSINSFLGSFYNLNFGDRNFKCSIELEKIRVENGSILYTDRTKQFLELYNKNLNDLGIVIEYN